MHLQRLLPHPLSGDGLGHPQLLLQRLVLHGDDVPLHLHRPLNGPLLLTELLILGGVGVNLHLLRILHLLDQPDPRTPLP